jgi:hypothetical protein
MMRLFPVWVEGIVTFIRCRSTFFWSVGRTRIAVSRTRRAGADADAGDDGGKSPAWMRNAMRTAEVLPNATYRMLPGQTLRSRPAHVHPLVEFLKKK